MLDNVLQAVCGSWFKCWVWANIRVIVYHLLALGTCYEETRYDQWNPQQEARERQRAIKALERLGYTVTVERAA